MPLPMSVKEPQDGGVLHGHIITEPLMVFFFFFFKKQTNIHFHLVAFQTSA